MSTENSREGWRSVRLGDVVIRTSKRCTPDLSDSVRWVGADHLDEGDLSIRRWSTTDDPMFPPTFCFGVPTGSVLLHSRNPKKVAILPFDAITGEKLFCLSPADKTTLDSRFLAYQLQSDHFHEFVGRWLSGSVNKFLNWTALERYEFALPPINEQQQIIALVAENDNLVDALGRTVAEANALSHSVMSSLTSTLGGTPTTLGEVATWRRGYSFKGSDYGTESDVPFLTLASVARSGGYRAEGLKFLRQEPRASCVASPHDLLIANTDLTPGREFIGRPFMVPDRFERVGFSHHLSMVSVEDLSLREWLFWEMQSRESREFVRSISRGSTVIMLDMKVLGNWPLRVPSAEVRQSILQKVNAVVEVAETANEEAGRAKVLRKDLLELLIGGANVQ